MARRYNRPMRIAVGSDHAGFDLKTALATHMADAGHQVDDPQRPVGPPDEVAGVEIGDKVGPPGKEEQPGVVPVGPQKA